MLKIPSGAYRTPPPEPGLPSWMKVAEGRGKERGKGREAEDKRS